MCAAILKNCNSGMTTCLEDDTRAHDYFFTPRFKQKIKSWMKYTASQYSTKSLLWQQFWQPILSTWVAVEEERSVSSIGIISRCCCTKSKQTSRNNGDYQSPNNKNDTVLQTFMVNNHLKEQLKATKVLILLLSSANITKDAETTCKSANISHENHLCL